MNTKKDIAPHEGNELDMILAGTKVFAVLSATKHDKLIERCKACLRVLGGWNYTRTLYRVFSVAGGDHNSFYLHLVNNKNRYIEIFGIEMYQRSMGKLFGYTDEQINSFIASDIDCTCDNCGG
jgi:hypothetical protein